METNDRIIALKWWHEKSLEEQFYITIKNNHLVVGDHTRHPNSLTGSEIEKLFISEHNEDPYIECDATESDIY